MVFVDTGAWFALYVPSDPNHDRVQDWVRSNRTALLTTDYCIDETLTLLVHRRRPAKAVEAGRMFFHTARVQLHFVNQNQFERAWILFQQRAAAGWSFTDCTSKIVIDDFGICTAAALDEHFRQFGITIIP
jgi:uncharacterized protein